MHWSVVFYVVELLVIVWPEHIITILHLVDIYVFFKFPVLIINAAVKTYV